MRETVMECETETRRPERPPRPVTQSSTSTTADECMDNIRTLRDEAYLYLEQGLSCDEQGQTQQAYTLYKKGLTCINKALQYARNIPQAAKTGGMWDSTQNRVHKMEKTKLEIESRVEMLKLHDDVMRSISDPPPAYELASSTSLQDDMDSIMNDIDESDNNLIDCANALEIYNITSGVQIFFISPEGHVSAPSYPSSLGIYKFSDSDVPVGASNIPERPPAFLKVGSWVYPLSSGSSPALQAFWGAYVFPDATAGEGCSVGVIIPDTVSAEQKSVFENTLNELTALRIQESADDHFVLPEVPLVEPEADVRPTGAGEQTSGRTSETIAKGLVTAGEWIAWGLGKGAEKAGDLIKYSSSKLKENLEPAAKPRKIDPRAQTGIYYTRKATGAAVKVSGYLVTKLGEATVALGRQVAPHVRKQGEKILPASWKKQDGGRSKIDDVAEVAVGGIRSWATVYVGLEKAAKSLAKNIADQTVHVVHHKYGGEASKFTEHTVYSAGNIGMAAYNFNHLGVKAIAKRAAKDTGKAVAEDYSEKKKPQELIVEEENQVHVSKRQVNTKIPEKQ